MIYQSAICHLFKAEAGEFKKNNLGGKTEIEIALLFASLKYFEKVKTRCRWEKIRLLLPIEQMPCREQSQPILRGMPMREPP
jgi:hypothetical protein